MENTPANVITELQRIQAESSKGVQALYDAEIRLAESENALDKAESLAFLNAEGTVADRQAIAKLESAQNRLERDIAKAEVNRVRTKLKVLESASMATSTIARQVELQWRG